MDTEHMRKETYIIVGKYESFVELVDTAVLLFKPSSVSLNGLAKD